MIYLPFEGDSAVVVTVIVKAGVTGAVVIGDSVRASLTIPEIQCHKSNQSITNSLSRDDSTVPGVTVR